MSWSRRLAAGILALGVPSRPLAATLHVPADYPTIQQAIDASGTGDMILVAPGTYHERLIMPTDRILASESGASATTIDADRLSRVITVLAGPGTVEIYGFTIRNGLETNAWGGGINVIGDDVARIHDNVFLNNESTWGGGGLIYAGGTEFGSAWLELRNNHFDNNRAGRGGAAMISFDAGAIEGNTFSNCVAETQGGAIDLSWSTTLVHHNVIVNCSAANFGGGIMIGNERCPMILYNTLVGCSSVQGGGLFLGNQTGVIEVRNNIVVGSPSGYGIYGASAFPPHVDCNDVWDNLPQEQQGINPGPGQISADPRFCDPLIGDYALDAASPCAPAHAPDCGRIGAVGVGCGVTATQPITWGALKANGIAR